MYIALFASVILLQIGFGLTGDVNSECYREDLDGGQVCVGTCGWGKCCMPDPSIDAQREDIRCICKKSDSNSWWSCYQPATPPCKWQILTNSVICEGCLNMLCYGNCSQPQSSSSAATYTTERCCAHSVHNGGQFNVAGIVTCSCTRKKQEIICAQ